MFAEYVNAQLLEEVRQYMGYVSLVDTRVLMHDNAMSML